MHEHERFMRVALDEALLARDAGEVPVGAVVVAGGEIVGRGHNASLALHDPSAHAEVLAMRDAAARLLNYRLVDTTLYCTVEPCLMCLGTAIHARVTRLVFGATDFKVGAVGRLETLRALGAEFNHRVETTGGVLAEEASALLLAASLGAALSIRRPGCSLAVVAHWRRRRLAPGVKEQRIFR